MPRGGPRAPRANLSRDARHILQHLSGVIGVARSSPARPSERVRGVRSSAPSALRRLAPSLSSLSRPWICLPE
eukprot:6093362-Pyramimonas_sp.AAC.1